MESLILKINTYYYSLLTQISILPIKKKYIIPLIILVLIIKIIYYISIDEYRARKLKKERKVDVTVIDKYNTQYVIDVDYDVESFYFKSKYFYVCNEIWITLICSLVVLINCALDQSFDFNIVADKTIIFICGTVSVVLLLKVCLSGLIHLKIIETIFLLFQVFFSVLLSTHFFVLRNLLLFAALPGIGGSIMLFIYVKGQKDKKFERMGYIDHKLTPEEQRKQRIENEQRLWEEQFLKKGNSSSTNHRYQDPDEALYRNKHPGATDNQISNMVKFGENRPNG